MAYFNILDSCLFYPSRAEYPTCYGPNFTCPKLEVPAHGYLDVTGLTAGSKAEYECSILFIRKGSRKRTCLVYFSRNSEVERPLSDATLCLYDAQSLEMMSVTPVFRFGFKTSLIFVFSTTTFNLLISIDNQTVAKIGNFLNRTEQYSCQRPCKKGYNVSL